MIEVTHVPHNGTVAHGEQDQPPSPAPHAAHCGSSAELDGSAVLTSGEIPASRLVAIHTWHPHLASTPGITLRGHPHLASRLVAIHTWHPHPASTPGITLRGHPHLASTPGIHTWHPHPASTPGIHTWLMGAFLAPFDGGNGDTDPYSMSDTVARDGRSNLTAGLEPFPMSARSASTVTAPAWATAGSRTGRR